LQINKKELLFLKIY